MYFRDWWRNLERSLNSDIKILMGNRWGNGELGVLKYFQLLPNSHVRLCASQILTFDSGYWKIDKYLAKVK
ncbi:MULTISPECIES: hypothetical protein [Okeania]|uniref:hypothetical protein n=1 Tax=Okeania TaxID=1458928 RepID=UPI000F547F80|nr:MULTISPECIES: hypothetical protein [Okeania]NEP06075.1 hypothetical protein [Okeania sp. SIO4D6]NEP44518.1 hypothetical protein [Okeania sp. SIO2H7]NET11847.1 hypothetical protein [Okeania sp. SIO1H6]NEP72727.1 hypothetical protein [Okeania sp. SIO2G5]NEP93361.1 hypothetical protein [Okeania sp. SIO2F5]